VVRDSPLDRQYWSNGARLNCEDAGYSSISPIKFIPAADRGNNVRDGRVSLAFDF
jgi:hypothetical protein